MISLIVIFTGCDKELSEIDEEKALKQLSVQEQELIQSTNSISLDIIKSAYLQNDEENFMFSPVSVGMALGMIYNGVGEKEKLQIQRFMGFESLVEKEINKSYNEILNFFQISDQQLNIDYANSMWFSNDININEGYRTKIMAYYDAEITELNFNKSAAYDYINTWGIAQTKGSFNQLIDNSPVLKNEFFLINAISLTADWKQSNNAFRSQNEFHLDDGQVSVVDMLNWDAMSIKLSESGDYSFMDIPFEKDLFLLSIIQPDEANNLHDLIDIFSVDELHFNIDNSVDHRANISLPELDFDADNSLKSTLSNVGLNQIFDESADLSPSFDNTHQKLLDINHLTKIRMNNVAISKSGSSFSNLNLRTIQVNKPFLYFVRDKHTNTLLFAGFYSNPQK